MLVGLAMISLAAGGFPAMYISSFKPISIMKGAPVSSQKGSTLKKVNLSLQFALTSILLIGTITVFRQVGFMKNANLGFDKEHMIVFTLNERQYGDKIDLIKRKLKSNPKVLGLSYSSAAPGKNYIADAAAETYLLNGIEYQLTYCSVDEDYQKTLGVGIIEGRFFDEKRPGDFTDFHNPSIEQPIYRVILNQTAVKMMGLTQPIGKSIKRADTDKEQSVIGVIEDFHLNSLQNPILPMIFYYTNYRNQVIVNISSNNMGETIRFIEIELEKFINKKPTVRFVDDEINKNYGDDQNFAELIGYLTLLAILIASMGLLGIASHAIKLRIKEIGIRKTMGASNYQILWMLTKPFVKVILISSCIAVPVGFFSMSSWLENYPYHTDLVWWVFGSSCGLTLIIAMSTIIWQSWQASSVNPARLIRYE